MFLTKKARLFALSLLTVSLVPSVQCMNQDQAREIEEAALARNIKEMKFDPNHSQFKMCQPASNRLVALTGLLGGAWGLLVGLPVASELALSSYSRTYAAPAVLAASVGLGSSLATLWALRTRRAERELYSNTQGLNVFGAAASDNVPALDAHKQYNARLMTATDNKRRTPLMYAAANKAENTAEYIINAVPANKLSLQDMSRLSAADYVRHLGLNKIAEKMITKLSSSIS